MRTAYYFVVELRRALFYRPSETRRAFDALYTAAEDPWRYGAEPTAAAHHPVALRLLDRHLPPGSTAFEVGCGEGVFTSLLSSRCEVVIASDVSTVALDRLRRRDLANVKPMVWDARTTPPGGSFDVVVCMDVLSYVHRPASQRSTARNIARLVAPGGLLLVSEKNQDELVESAWWARLLRRGARNVAGNLHRIDRELERVAEDTGGDHLTVVYRRGDQT